MEQNRVANKNLFWCHSWEKSILIFRSNFKWRKRGALKTLLFWVCRSSLLLRSTIWLSESCYLKVRKKTLIRITFLSLNLFVFGKKKTKQYEENGKRKKNEWTYKVNAYILIICIFEIQFDFNKVSYTN